MSVLNKGLTFVPINYKFNKNTLQSEVKNFERRLQLHNFFENIKMRKNKQQQFNTNTKTNSNETQSRIPFTKNPNFWPTPLNDKINIFCHNLKIDLYEMTKPSYKDNLTKKERLALKDIRSDTTITIKKGDKGAGIVIMNTQDYLDKVDKQLTDTNTYLKVQTDDTIQVKQKTDELIHSLYNLKAITYKQRRYLMNFKPQTPVYYGIPKVHKENVPLRPIVSQIDGPTSKLNELIDFYLSKAEKSIPNLLQDTTAFLHILQDLNKNFPITDDTYLITLDVTSLYTNIPQQEGATWVADYYEETKNMWVNPIMPLITKTKLYECIMHILTNTTFNFNGTLYRQLYGTTMGARFSVKFANTYMHVLLNKFLKEYKGEIPPLLARLVDDLFFIWNTNIDTINSFITALNNFHPTIKFTANISKTNIQFLDTIVYKKNNQLLTKLHIKPTDNKQYLHYYSSHPAHTKKSIPYSQAIRYRWIVVEDDELNSSLSNLRQMFLDRCYPETLVTEQINKVKNINREDTLKYKTKDEKQSKFKTSLKDDEFLPLSITFHPNYLYNKKTTIHKLIHTKWTEFLEQNSELQTTFAHTQIKAIFKKGATLAQLLTSSKFPPKWHDKPIISSDDEEIINLLALFLAK